MQLNMIQSSFLVLLMAITLLLASMLFPFLTSILWAALIAVLFHPLQTRLRPYFKHHRNLLALTVLLISIIMVILPISTLISALARESIVFFEKVQTGQFDLASLFDNDIKLPAIVHKTLMALGFDVQNLMQTVKDLAIKSGSFIGSQALHFGQNTAQFVFTLVLMLYLTFFFIRDGEKLVQQMVKALPLGNQRERLLVGRVAEVINAVVKGGLLVATVQGTLGGLIFWILGIDSPFLWGITMVLASLIPAIGSSLIWAPVGIYLLSTGQIWQGVVLLLFGVFIISMIDNILRPMLVGRGTGVPDYLVLVSTLGGIFMFGVNGFVLGPLVIALFISLWEMFIREYHPA